MNEQALWNYWNELWNYWWDGLIDGWEYGDLLAEAATGIDRCYSLPGIAAAYDRGGSRS